MENKKTKLTITGDPKKSFKKFDTSKSQGKKTVIIDKQFKKPAGKVHSKKPFSSETAPLFNPSIIIFAPNKGISLSESYT